MSNLFGRWIGYGIGSAVGRAIFGEDSGSSAQPSHGRDRVGTEADFRADEKRFAEDQKRLDADAQSAKK